MSIFSRQDFAVYPRWRGEHNASVEHKSSFSGLSPLARGTLLRVSKYGRACRFIPAGAGNTATEIQIKISITVYPRWRGEHYVENICNTRKNGLSPLARGTPCASNHSFGDTRFIPAGAGNTTVTKSVSGRVSVYPRWRGEHESTFINISCTGGLSVSVQ